MSWYKRKGDRSSLWRFFVGSSQLVTGKKQEFEFKTLYKNEEEEIISQWQFLMIPLMISLIMIQDFGNLQNQCYVFPSHNPF